MSEQHDPTGELARLALGRFGCSDACVLTLCNVSENHTYRVQDPGSGARYALRVHRPGYRTVPEIESELDWIEALRVDGVIETPGIRATVDGSRVASVTAEGIGPRNVVMFDWLDGAAPDVDAGQSAVDQFEILGSVSARMHLHVRTWRPPPGFTRPRWDYEHSIGARGHWGAWRDGLGMGPEELRVLGRLEETIARRLDDFGQGADRFGLVHADTRLANLLVQDGHVRVIDFDDCGYSWFMYEFATSVSFMEDHPSVPELRDAWLRGYRTVAALDAPSEAELATMVMLRRLLLVAWIGSHHTFAPEAAQLGAGFTAGTCALAEDYLSTHSS